ncbi:MAG TPA: CheR family methyltransferase [Bryobacteraceae bacterium]|nr:CheR family methyltransferase [Bryobacteraceae bacterium]
MGSHPYLTSSAEALEQPMRAAEEDGKLRQILDLLKAATRIDFVQYKHSTLRRRIGRRLVLHHLSTLGEYLEYLRAHPPEIHHLYRDVLISVTSFFREPEMFQILSHLISEYLVERNNSEPFRLWTPGCATGEEAYSLAIAVLEVLEAGGREIPVQVFGTDISEAAIDKARSGVYAPKIEQEISPERLRRFFSRVDSGYRINPQVRECCIFARHDLSNDPPFSQMDLVSCRNVFIYLNVNLQQRILPSLHYSLKPGGMLVLGSAETVGNRSDLFAVLNNENKIYTKNPVQSQPDIEMKFQEPYRKSSESGNREALPSTGPAIADLEFRAARILRDLYAPPGVVINRESQVLHFHGRTEFFLERVPGEASLNLLRLAKESLVHPLRRAIDLAFENNQVVHESGIEVRHSGETRPVRLTVIPTADHIPACLVLFEQDGRLTGDLQVHERVAEPESTSLTRAERELAQTRDYLRTVVEQHEAATEELRAANEEARSSNEELQSTNEELRTAKEELQSSNEELTTVNDELRHRYFELDLATNDLSNILSAATIPILMVGMDLKVRRFTPASEKLLGLVSSDFGRMVTDIRLAFISPTLRRF